MLICKIKRKTKILHGGKSFKNPFEKISQRDAKSIPLRKFAFIPCELNKRNLKKNIGILIVFVLLDLQFSVQCFVNCCLSFWSLSCLSFFRFTASEYDFGIFKLFLQVIVKNNIILAMKACKTLHNMVNLLNCLYQARKVSGHVYICQGYSFCLSLRFFYWILELFRQYGGFFQGQRVMVFNATFNNISIIQCRSVLLVEETEVSGENRRSVVNFIT